MFNDFYSRKRRVPRPQKGHGGKGKKEGTKQNKEIEGLDEEGG